MNPSILAIDIGTSSCKAAAFSAEGELIALGKAGYPLLFPKTGWVEQDPDVIVEGVGRAVRDLESKGVNLSKVRALSFSAQTAAQCLVDDKAVPLTNLMSWMDGRAKEEVRIFTEQFSQERTEELTGVDMIVTPAYSIAKLRWLSGHQKDVLDRAHKFVQIKDYIIYQLTGRWVSDVTSLKGLVNYQTERPVPEIMEFTGAGEELLPEVCKPYEIAGYLKEDVKGFESLPVGIPVVTGWNDMNAAFLGMGALLPGRVGLDLTGTSEHLGCVTPCIEVDRERYSGLNRVPFLNGREVFYGVTSSGGLAVEWFVRDFMGAPSVKGYFDRLFEEAGGVPEVRETGPVFLPYLEGERNPWNNPDACGVFFGLNRSHRQVDVAMAVLEGVCFALRAIYDRFPVFPEKVVVSGGASFNQVWNQMKADVMNVPFVRLATTEAGCTGAAILAMAALNPQKTLEETAAQLFKPVCTYQPDQARHLIYEKKYRRFLSLYHKLESMF